MVTIYKTNTMKDAANYVLNILKRVDKRNLSVLHTVIVPDRASLEAERALLKTLGGSFNVQVKTFRRFANDILPKYDYLSKQAGIMALSEIIRDNRDKLTCYTKGVETAGFVEEMYDTISMMKYCKISPERLNCGDLPRSVQSKARDIALLYRAYLDFNQGRFIDSADKLDILKENISDSDSVKNGCFYIYDFDNFSKQESELVERLVLTAKDVVVACCASDKKYDRHLYLNDIYASVADICKRNGIEYKDIPGESYSNEYVEQIGRNLYRYYQNAAIENDGFAEIFNGATRVQEVYALACRVKRFVQNGGRYKDIYVVTSDVNAYSNAISTVFEQFGIPYFCDKQFALAEHPYARFILDYLTLCKNNGKAAAVLQFVKNYLFCGAFDKDDDVENVYHFENYCLKYNVSYKYDGFTLGVNEPFFARADAFRAKFNRLYKRAVFPANATVKQYTDLVRNLIDISDLRERVSTFGKRQENANLGYESKVSLQVCEKFDSVLDNADAVIGERYLSLDEFIKTLTAGIASSRVSVIPVRNDCVVFANMAKARKHDVKFLALLGANYGAMPIIKRDCKLLTDNNIKDLIGAGINVEPQILTENRRERFSLFQLLQEPSNKLYVSYASADGGNALVPSPFVAELCKLFKSGGKNLSPTAAADEEVYSEKQAVSKIVTNKRKLKDNRFVNMPAYQILSDYFEKQTEGYVFDKDGKSVSVERGGEIYLKNSSTSVSQLTDFFKCPYRFYVQYGLNVKPRSVSKLQSADLGNILHSVLEHYVRDMEEEESEIVTEQKALKWFEFTLNDDFYKGMRSDPQMAGTLKMLEAEAARMCKVVKKQIVDSNFKNLQTEMAFGGEGQAPAVEVDFDGGKFKLVGKIDRVDVNGGRFIVIDYKSGASAAHFTEKDLYIGHKMQLPVYVKAVKDSFNLRPAGFYYFNMHDNFTDYSSENVYVYNGRTLDDADVACDIDVNLKNGKSEKLGIKLKSDGTLSRTGDKLLTDGQFDNQINYAFELISKAGNLMSKGYASVNPYKGTCDYCDYKDICDFGDVYNYDEREVKAKKIKETIDETVKK